MQLTKTELQRQAGATNKEAYFLKNPNRVLVINVPSGDLRFSIDLERLTPFMLEYLTYQTDADRALNEKFNHDRYGIYGFLSGIVDTTTAVNSLKVKSAQFSAWLETEANAEKFNATLDSVAIDGIMLGLGMTDEEIFYLVRDDAQKVSGIDLSDITYDSDGTDPEPEPEPGP